MNSKKNGKMAFLFSVLLLAAVMAGCGLESREDGNPSAAKIELAYPESMQEQGFTEPVILEKPPVRVVSLANTPVLVLRALGIPQAAVPDTKIVEWPEDMKEIPRIQTGMRSNIDIESVVSLQPDLVIVGIHAKDTYGKLLEQENIPVYYVEAGPGVSYQSVKDMTLCLTDALGKNSKAAEDIRKSFAEAEEKAAEERTANKGKKVMIIQGSAPHYYLQNNTGTTGSMFQMLGYDNVAASDAGSMVPLNQEEALSYQPDLLVFVEAMNGAEEHKAIMEKEFARNAAYWGQFEAISKKQVLYLPKWFAVSGGLEEIQQLEFLIKEEKALREGSHE